MERAIYYLGFMWLLVCIESNANNRTEIYHAFISNDMDKWKKTIEHMNSKMMQSDSYMFELVNYEYGYIAWCIGNKREKEAENWIIQAENLLSVLEKKTSNLSQVKAYRAAICGFKIGLNNFKAPFLGPKSISNAETAIRLDAQNPFGYIQYAHAYFYMPVLIGGSKKKAIDNYLKAETLMRSQKYDNRQDWNYLALLTNIANGYAETGNYKQARLWFEKILKIEPTYLWVRDELYPKLLNKTN